MPRHLGSLGTSDGTIGTIGMLTGTRASVARPARAESGRGASTSRPGRLARVPRRASRSPGEVADGQTPDDADEDPRIKLGAVAATSQIFKNMPKLERKAERKVRRNMETLQPS